MNTNWTTILTFTYPHEAHLARTKLESEGIEVMIKDELTVQVDNFYSNAIGGVKLQVSENDFDRALQILKDCDYITEPPQKDHTLLSRIDKVSSKMPFIGKLILEFRLLILVALLLMIMIIPFAFFTLPSMQEQLTKNSWCVDRFIYQGKQYQPRTAGLRVVFNKDCTETFTFDKKGTIDLPGFDTHSVQANWKIEKNKLMIYNSDTLKHIYNGSYSIDIDQNSITIRSENTTIIGHLNKLIW